MGFIKGIKYNLQGLALGLKTPKLLFLGAVRFVAVVLITIFAAGAILVYHQEILNLIWSRPESHWVLWAWHLLSWLLSLVLVGLSAVLSYLISQILFSVFIMDQMSRITEKMRCGHSLESDNIPFLHQFFYLVQQEIPRATIPVLLALVLVMLGWLTPLGPVITVVSSAVGVIFLAWDNTDLIPARQMESFKKRFKTLLKTLLFHLGFGSLFLIPVLNILFLSFAPVGAALYYLDHHPPAPQGT